LAVFNHHAQSFPRKFRIERHVGASGFQNAKKTDDHFEGTGNVNADWFARPQAGTS
jgi:hypothetical protein